jgi:hypothetical protein
MQNHYKISCPTGHFQELVLLVMASVLAQGEGIVTTVKFEAKLNILSPVSG